MCQVLCVHYLSFKRHSVKLKTATSLIYKSANWNSGSSREPLQVRHLENGRDVMRRWHGCPCCPRERNNSPEPQDRMSHDSVDRRRSILGPYICSMLDGTHLSRALCLLAYKMSQMDQRMSIGCRWWTVFQDRQPRSIERVYLAEELLAFTLLLFSCTTSSIATVDP